MTDYFRQRLASRSLSREDHERLADRLVKFTSQVSVQELLADVLNVEGATSATQMTALRVMAKSRMTEPPTSWTKPIERLLHADDPGVRNQALATVRSFNGKSLPSDILAELQRLSHNEHLEAETRLTVLTALPNGVRRFPPETVGFLQDHVAADRPSRIRSRAADVLSQARLESSQLEALAATLVTTGPMELRSLLATFEQAPNEGLGLKLVGALEQCTVASALGEEALEKLFTKFGPTVSKRAAALFARVEQENRDKRKQLESVLSLLPKSDVRRGQQVFHSTKTACGACHELGYLGGSVGSSLTRIGRIRTERDLPEAILFPSASFVRSFEPLTIVTVDGQVHNGVVRDENAEEIALAIDAQKVVRVPVTDIAERRPGAVSIMPTGLEKQLTPQQLADLVAFLKVAQ